MFGLERWMLTTMAAALVAIGLYGGGFWHGWSMASDKWKTEKAQIIADSEIRAKMLEQKGLSLAADLEKARAQVKVQTVEVVREVVKYVKADRPAFADPNLAGVLNSMSGIRETITREGPAGTVTTSRETSPDPARSPAVRTSEKALAEWIANAVQSHENCRNQANALIDYAKACSGSK